MDILNQWHLIFSMSLWMLFLYFMILAYRHSDRFKISKMTWFLLFLTYTFFVIRELVHISPGSAAQLATRMFGSLSAISMTATFYFMYLQIYRRKDIQKTLMAVPFAIMVAVMIMAVYLPRGVSDIVTATAIMSIVENILWIAGGLAVACYTYLLGSKMSAGRFLYIFMLFHFSAFFAVIWGVTGLSDIFGGDTPRFIEEALEFLFMIFSGTAIYIFMQVLREEI